MDIIIKSISHNTQRLGQPGDWWFDEQGNLQVRVSEVGDWRMEFLFARHEMDEAILCKYAGITTSQVDEYDTRPSNVNDDPDSFSGYPGAPYQKQHNDALAAEWQMARLLGVDWAEYGEMYEPFWG